MRKYSLFLLLFASLFATLLLYGCGGTQVGDSSGLNLGTDWTKSTIYLEEKDPEHMYFAGKAMSGNNLDDLLEDAQLNAQNEIARSALSDFDRESNKGSFGGTAAADIKGAQEALEKAWRSASSGSIKDNRVIDRKWKEDKRDGSVFYSDVWVLVRIPKDSYTNFAKQRILNAIDLAQANAEAVRVLNEFKAKLDKTGTTSAPAATVPAPEAPAPAAQ